MPIILNEYDIENMIEQERASIKICEGLPIFSKIKGEKKPLIDKGLKIRHSTGLTYTCKGLMRDTDDDSVVIVAIDDGDGRPVLIHSSEFSEYERV